MPYRPYNMVVQDTQGRALSGATVWFCTQPAVIANPPSPLATIYSDTAGDVMVNPVTSNNYGQVIAYLDTTLLYTVVTYHPLTGLLAYKDQWVGGPNNATFSLTGEQPSGAINGSNVTFTLATTPNPPGALLLIVNGLLMTQGLGYTLSGNIITLATAPQIGDSIYAYVPTTVTN